MESLFGSFVESLASLARPDVILIMVIGSVVGSIMGIIPGLSSGVACALALPFIFGMEPVLALVLLCSLTSVTHTGGALSAIILGIPGVPSSAATVIDGFAMTQKGEGGRAIGAAVMASMLGGVAAIAFAFVMIPLVIPLVLNFKSSELFLTVIVGLCFVVALIRGSRIRGFISAGLGLLLSYVGFQMMTGASRFTFNSQYLYSGIDLLIALLGLFAIPVLLAASVTGKTIAPVESTSTGKFSGVFQGVRDVFTHWWLWLRSTVIGYVVGLIPGIGSEAAIWTAYGQAKQTSKHPEIFGTGCIEGVIAPESADNSKEGGALLTTLSFGIPGSGIMAFFLAAFLIVGIQPGPKMLLEHTPLCFTMLLGAERAMHC